METIQFGKGMYRNPSMGKDGELDYCCNLMPKDGEMMNVPRVEGVGVNLPEGSNLLCIHQVQEGDHYIFINSKDIDGQSPTIKTLEFSLDGANWEFKSYLERDVTINLNETVTIQFNGTYNSRLGDGGSIITNSFSFTKTFDADTGTIDVVNNKQYGTFTTELPSGVGIANVIITDFEVKDVNDCYCRIAGESRPRKIKPKTTTYQGKALYYKSAGEPDTTKHLIKILPEQVDSISILGNTLIIQSDHIYYCVWKDGEYIWLGSDFPEPLIQFRLRGEYQRYFKQQYVKLTAVPSGIKDLDYSKVVTAGAESSGTNIISFSALTPQKSYLLRFSKFQSAGYKRKYKIYGKAEGENFELIGDTTKHRSPQLYFVASKAYTQIKWEDGRTEHTYTLLEGIEVDKYMFKSTNEDQGFTGYNQIMGIANEFINRYGKADNKFVYPFFVRYGLRLYDGSFVHLSSPCLMLSNTGTAPFIWSFVGEGNVWLNIPLDTYCEGMVSALQMKIISSADFSLWKDLITDVVIAVSSPFYRYNEGKNFDPADIGIKIKTTYATYESSGNYTHLLDIAGGGSFFGFWNIGESENESEDWMSGEWSQRYLHDYYYNNNTDGAQLIQYCLPEFKEEEIVKNVSECGTFHIIKSYKADEFSVLEGYDHYADIELDDDTLGGLESRTVLNASDDIIRIGSSTCQTVYNQRVVLGDVYKEITAGYHPTLMNGQCHNKWRDVTAITSKEKITLDCAVVEYNENGRIYKVARMDYGLDECLRHCYAFYPLSGAKRMTIYGHDSYNVRYFAVLDMKDHPNMEGSVYFQGYEEIAWEEMPWSGTAPNEVQDPVPFAADQSAEIHYPNLLVQSKANNPFVFPLNLQNWIGNKSIMALCANTHAISQGQFGQHPMYAFTEEGIWALSVGGNGEFAAVQPVSRDVCNNVDSIVQTDQMIVFSTDQGLKILGSNTRMLAPQMHGLADAFPDNINVLDSWSLLNINDAQAFNTLIRHCRTLYDYTNDILHVYPTSTSPLTFGEMLGWHYGISLVDGETFLISESTAPRTLCTSYPTSLITYDAIVNNVNVVAVRKYVEPTDTQNTYKGLLLTRPTAMGNPFQMKMLTDMRSIWRKKIARSGDAKGVQVQILVSNDRFSWAELGSLRKHSFKWYRFAIYTDMTDDERLSSLTLETDARRDNKMR